MRKSSQFVIPASDAGNTALAPDPAPAPARVPQRARGHLRVDALLASAAEVFARKGFELATMTEIAAQADSSIGSLYQFFRTKEAIGGALLQAQVEALWERFDDLAGRAGALSTAALGGVLALLLVEFRQAHPSFARLVEAPVTSLELVNGVRRRLRERLVEVLACHAPSTARATLLAMAPVVQQTMKAAVQIQAELEGAERAAALRELEAMLAGYLALRLAPAT